MILDWAEDALRDLQDTYEFIHNRTSQSAAEHQDHILRVIDDLLGWPYLGRASDVNNTRSLLVWPGPYRVVYQVVPPTLTVLRVIHGKRPWPV